MDFSQKLTRTVNTSLSLVTLKLSLRTSGLKTQTVRQLVRSADPIHHKQALAEVVRVMGSQKATEMTLEELYNVLEKQCSKAD
jgi:hypothetical protein